MEITKQGDLYVTNFGLELLEQHPDFVENVWMNEERREFLFKTKGIKDRIPDTYFTKITNVNGEKYIEKQSEDGLTTLQRYDVLEQILKKEGWDSLRPLKPYFARKDIVLFENMIEDFGGIVSSSVNLEDQERMDIAYLSMRYGWNKEFGRGEDGMVVIYDPHCPTDIRFA